MAPRKNKTEKRTRKTDDRPAEVVFGEKMATELQYWDRRHDNVRKIAYSRAARGATTEQINAAIQHLQSELEQTLGSLRTIPERQALAGATNAPKRHSGPFSVPGLGTAKRAPAE